jgi:hypothetical protein
MLHNAVNLSLSEAGTQHSAQSCAAILTHTNHNAVIYPAKCSYYTHQINQLAATHIASYNEVFSFNEWLVAAFDAVC